MNAPDPVLLRQLARLYGVQTGYAGMGGEHVEANPDSVLAVLEALGANTDDIASSINLRRRELWHRRLQPVLVAWEGDLPAIYARVPAGDLSQRFEMRLTLETGDVIERRLSNLPATSRTTIDGVAYARAAMPGFRPLPLGYHRLELSFAGVSLRSLVIAAPRRTYAAPDRRTWGPFLPLYALHSRRSWGVGDLTDLDAFIDWAASRGAGFVGTLPLLASFLEEPFEPSPYAPVSRLFWNELFIDPARPIAPSQPEIADHSVEMPAEAAALNDEALVPYRKAMALKRRVLEAQLASLLPDERDAMQRYVDQHPRLRDYARFRAAGEAYGPNWRQWPGPARDGDLDNIALPEDAEAYHTYAQWRIATQMAETARQAREKGVALYLDLPVGVQADGYDAWRYQDLFVDGMSVGAPPDVVTTSGQDWGFQPLAPEALRRSSYAYFIAYLRHHFETA
ncbi:MAG TPA: 4-alpha-glucanotransferase, partial [Dehalococcoidia bacterium]|nr:4-alpha-glucanotransferase [Dehalococcoidia bacterium]